MWRRMESLSKVKGEMAAVSVGGRWGASAVAD
jgi:hypothetical protein